MDILITLKVCSSVPGHSGSWLLAANREVPAIPRAGDHVELADGWCSEDVWYVTFCANGEVHVALRVMKIDDLDRLAEMNTLVTDGGAGWFWYGDDGPFGTRHP